MITSHSGNAFVVRKSAGPNSKETPLSYLHIAISGVVPAARLMFPEVLLEIVELVSYWVRLRCMPIIIGATASGEYMH